MTDARSSDRRRRPPLLVNRLRGMRSRHVIPLLLKAGVFAALVLTLVFFSMVLFLPLPTNRIPQATRLFDAKNRPISSVFVENRIVVPSKEIAPDLKNAVVAVEDKRFFVHHGVDLEALFRALVHDIRARAFVEGGSTITQQLAKNMFLTQEKTLLRKFVEAAYTLKLEMRYTKDEILTMYLNQIYWGHGTWGCEVASRAYFGKPAKDLTLSDSALLAGIIRSPENYSPYNDRDAGIRRRDLVLDLMTDQGYLNPSQRDAAKNRSITLAGLPKSVAPYFVRYVIQQIQSRRPEIGQEIYRGGYQIYTTLDLDFQKAAEDAFAANMPQGTEDAQGITQPQGALIAIEPATGYVKAMIGGRDWDETQLNRAYQVKRQPGSAFKIFLYAAVIDRRHPVTQTQWCAPVTYPGAAPGETYRPVDFGRQPYHYQALDVRQAVTVSDNVVATKWAQVIGPATIADYARRMGIKSALDASIPLALGASDVVPLDMAVAAATLAAEGVKPEPLSVLRVLDARGQVIEENRIRRASVLDPGTSYVLTSVLRSVLSPYGTGAGLKGWLGSRPVAGKTGTTDNQLEAWFVGYSRDLACTVYVGWDNRERSLSGTGGGIAGPIWADFMGTALQNTPVKDWPVPSNVTWAEVCDQSGLLAGPNCRSRHYEVFLRAALPAVDTATAEGHAGTVANYLKGIGILPEVAEGEKPVTKVPPVRPEETTMPGAPAYPGAPPEPEPPFFPKGYPQLPR